MSIIVIDPGHGGDAKVGGSSPNNARGPSGLLETDLHCAGLWASHTISQVQGASLSAIDVSDLRECP